MQDELEGNAIGLVMLASAMKPPLCWFAVQVRETAVRYVADHLLKKGFECFVPAASVDLLQDERRNRPNTLVPPNYVICRFDIRRQLPILMTPGVLGILSVGGVPTPFEDDEIFSLQTAAVEGR